MTKQILTQEYIHSLFDYREGFLYWKVSRVNTIKIGDKAGCIDTQGYWKVNLDYKIVPLHRLIFLYHHGYLPEFIDHIDGNQANNLIENLRAVTKQQNQYNQKKRSDNTSGYKGVFWVKQKNKWQVKIHVSYKQIHCGFFEDIELADLVAQEARNKYHGEFANHGHTR